MEHKCKLTKVKAELKLYQNTDQMMQLVREFEESIEILGHHSLLKEAKKYAKELDIE